MRLQGWFVRLGVLLALTAVGVLGLSASAFAAGITVDHSTSGPSTSLTIETSQPNELILIAADGWPASETRPTVTVDGSAAGLVSFEASEPFNTGGASVFQFVAPSAGLHTIELSEGGYCSCFVLNFAASLLDATNAGLTSTSLSSESSATITDSIATSTPDQYVFATSTQNTVESTPGVLTWTGAPETPTLLQSLHVGTGIDSSIAGFNAPTPGTYSATVSDSEGGNGAGGGAIVLVAAHEFPPPTAEIKTPETGGTYTQGEVIHTKFSCSEGAGGPGIASCTDENSVPSTEEGTLETTMLGSHTYTVTAKSKDGLEGKAKIEYSVVPAAPACKTAEGAGTYKKRGETGRLNLRDKLSTNTSEAEFLQLSTESGAVHFGLKKLTSASCGAIEGGFAFSGEGPAREYKKTGYTIHFSISVTKGKTYFSSTLTKGATVIHEAIGEPLSKSNEVIH
jgi:hypothetical protein